MGIIKYYMHGIYKKSAGKDICVPIYRNALKEHFSLIIDIVQIYFATIKLNKYFTCLIFSCFFYPRTAITC